MPPPFRPSSYCERIAGEQQAILASCVIKLFQAGLNPGPGVVVADLDNDECDFDDYVPIVVTAWLDPSALPNGSWQIIMPTQQFLCTAAQVVSNMVGGWWIEEDTTGEVLLVRELDAPIVMATAGNSVPVSAAQVFGPGI